MSQDNYTAVDVSKDSLQVFDDKKNTNIKNDTANISRFCKRTAKDPNAFVICEATGGYERPLIKALHNHGIKVGLVSPCRVRAFAKSEGVRAKTDPIDAQMLLKFAKEKKPRETPAPTPQKEELVMLMDRRSQRTTDLTKEKNRLEKCLPAIKSIIDESIAFIEAEIKQLETQIKRVVRSCPTLKKQDKTLRSIKGVSSITSWAILAYMSEIIHLDRNSLVALAGVAPFNKDSGKSRQKRRIVGGRAKVRRCLFMAARTAAKHNPIIKEYVDGLITRGKHYKMAIVAAMRKLLIHMQTLLKNLEYA